MALVENPSEVTECGEKKKTICRCLPSRRRSGGKVSHSDQTIAALHQRVDVFFFMLFIFESTVRTAPVAPPCLPWGRAWLAHLQLLFHLTHHMTAAEHALLVKCDFY